MDSKRESGETARRDADSERRSRSPGTNGGDEVEEGEIEHHRYERRRKRKERRETFPEEVSMMPRVMPTVDQIDELAAQHSDKPSTLQQFREKQKVHKVVHKLTPKQQQRQIEKAKQERDEKERREAYASFAQEFGDQEGDTQTMAAPLFVSKDSGQQYGEQREATSHSEYQPLKHVSTSAPATRNTLRELASELGAVHEERRERNSRHREDLSLHSNVFVGNLGVSVTHEELMSRFGVFGDIHRVKVLEGPKKAFVLFRHPEDAKECVEALQGSYFGGQPIMLERSENPHGFRSSPRPQGILKMPTYQSGKPALFIIHHHCPATRIGEAREMELARLLHSVTVQRESIQNLMCFAIDNAQWAQEIMEKVIQLVVSQSTATAKKLALLYVINDILANLQVPGVRGLLTYSTVVQVHIKPIFTSLRLAGRSLGRISRSRFMTLVEDVERIWMRSQLFPDHSFT